MIKAYVLALEDAPDRGERGRIIKDLCSFTGWGKDKVYKELKNAGYDSGRRKRKDSGGTRVSEEALRDLGAYLKTGIRANGKIVIDIPTARQVLQSNGVEFGVSNGRLGTLLRDRGIDIKTQKQPTPYVKMRSLYPNQLHQVDPSVCLVYYLPRGGQKIIDEREVYKNKPWLVGKEDLKVWRYVLTDHYSGSICVKYYQSAGEKQIVLWDFLLYAWGKKEDPYYQFHGVPELLTWDKGSANMSKAITNAVKGLRIETFTHAVGNPRAKGQVEGGNKLVERLFESRLKAEPVMGLDELNKAVEGWCASYNADIIEGYSAKLKRAEKSRLDLWQTIPFDKLHELPEGARELLVDNPVKRQVSPSLSVSFVHPLTKVSMEYSVGGLPGIRPGLKVDVQPVLMDAGGILRVNYTYMGEEISEELLPLEKDEAGFLVDAPVWGESFKRNPDTAVQTAGKELEKVIGESKIPFADFNEGRGLAAVSAITRRKTNIQPVPRTGTAIKGPEAPQLIITSVEAAFRLRSRLGYWEPEYLKLIRGMYPNGVPERDLSKIEEIITEGGSEQCAQ